LALHVPGGQGDPSYFTHKGIRRIKVAYRRESYLFTDDAWRLVSETMAAPTLLIGEQCRDAQSKRAKKPRGKVADNGETIDQVIQKLALNPQHRRDTAKELWTHFGQLLRENDLDLKEIEDPEKLTYEYDFKNGRKKITFRGFEGVVSKVRVEKKKIALTGLMIPSR
jgi:hypothetical protein